MRVLIGCEFSGVVRDAFIARGHDAWSCDLLPTTAPGPHIQGDILDVISDEWDIGIFHPPCTYLCVSGLHWNSRREGRQEQTEQALRFVRKLLDAPIDRIALENPIGCISTRIRQPTQIVQPYEFGDDASKATCLWLKNLPRLKPTQRFNGRIVIDPAGRAVERWSNQTDSGQNALPPSDDRWAERSVTYQGIANAMAGQWSVLSPIVEQMVLFE